MSMDESQAKMLQETHDTVVALAATLEERCPQCQEDVDRLSVFVNGNGHKGVKVRLHALERQAKIVWVTAGGVLTLLGDTFVAWLRG